MALGVTRTPEESHPKEGFSSLAELANRSESCPTPMDSIDKQASTEANTGSSSERSSAQDAVGDARAIGHNYTSEETKVNGHIHANELHSRRNYDFSNGISTSNAPRVGTNGANDTSHTKQVVVDNSSQGARRGSIDTIFSESKSVPPRNLGFIQTTSLMLNATLGGGPFVTAGYVLALTRSKPLALGLWGLGGVYTALSMLVYLEYGTALPYNGGALIYLDEMFPTPRLLATVIFSVFWIIKGSTYSPARTTAEYVLSAAYPETPMSKLSEGLVRYTAVVVQTLMCLLLYFLRRLCFVFNGPFALYKIVVLFIITIIALAHSRGDDSGWRDFNQKHSGYTSANALNAMLTIIYTYQGWDGANYVAGEIRDYKKILRWSAIATVSILTILQMLITLAWFALFDFDTLTSADGQDNVSLLFAKRVFGTSRGMELVVVVAIFSQGLFDTYIKAKVKQAIAWQRIIPFYNFFGRQDPQFDSPGGALLLHWFFTSLTLLIFRVNTAGRGFYTGIYQYGYTTIGRIGILRLRPRMRLINNTWNPTYLRDPVTLSTVAVIFISVNIIILVMTAIPSGHGNVPNYYLPVSIAGFVVFGVVYWSILQLLSVRGPSWHGKVSLGRKIGLEVEIYGMGDRFPEEMREIMHDALLDGSRRRLQYKVSGPTLWCQEGYYKAKKFILYHFGYRQ